jgi:AraC-like DNA-binding protein
VSGYVDFLDKIGAPVERGLEAARLPVEQGHDDAVVTVESVFDFVDSMSRREGIDNLGVEVGLAVQERAVQGPLRRMIASAPTLRRGIGTLGSHARAESSHMDIGLQEQGDSVLFWHRGPLPHHPGHGQMETYFVQALVGFVRAFAGSDWEPPVIGLEAPQVPERAQEAYPASRFLCGQSLHFIEVPRALLPRPPILSVPQEGPVPDRPTPLGSGLPEVLLGLLESYVSDQKLSLDFAAELIGVSTRTLQRRLQASGARFSDLVSDARHRVAARLLQDPKRTVTEVAHFVGYDDASHFTRAFRRMAGVAPREFRRSAGPTVA